MIKLTYENIKAHDGTFIRTARSEPAAVPAGVIQIVHGFCEGIEYYAELAEFFTRNGYACVIHDQRGFGKMPDKTPKEKHAAQGVAPGYQYYLEDVKTIRDKIGQWYSGLPVILYGFSMGGNIGINYLLRYSQEHYQKAILESPWLGLYKPLPGFAALMVRLIGKISMKAAAYARLNVYYFSRDREKINALKDDGIFHNRLSFRLYSEITQAGEYAIQNADRITVPMLLLCADEDKIVSPQAIREFSGKARPNVTFVEYPDGYHCLHFDIINAEVLNAMLAFCK